MLADDCEDRESQKLSLPKPWRCCASSPPIGAEMTPGATITQGEREIQSSFWALWLVCFVVRFVLFVFCYLRLGFTM